CSYLGWIKRQTAHFLQTGILTAGAGCRLEEVNQFLLARGRFLPAGSCRTVGLVGLTLGGGDGMFARKWGLTCDHLIRIKVVDGTGGARLKGATRFALEFARRWQWAISGY